MTDFSDWMRSIYLGLHSFKNQEEALRAAWDAGAAHEREECAKVCDKHWDDNGQHCANAIRSRT